MQLQFEINGPGQRRGPPPDASDGQEDVTLVTLDLVDATEQSFAASPGLQSPRPEHRSGDFDPSVLGEPTGLQDGGASRAQLDLLLIPLSQLGEIPSDYRRNQHSQGVRWSAEKCGSRADDFVNKRLAALGCLAHNAREELGTSALTVLPLCSRATVLYIQMARCE